MLPALIITRSRERHQVFLTWRKKLRLGTGEGSDLIVNHQRFIGQEAVLGAPGSADGEKQSKKWDAMGFFDVFTMNLDSAEILLIRPRIVFFVLAGIVLGGSCLSSFATKHDLLSPRQDWTAVELPAERVYGYCRQDRSHPDGVRFQFMGRAGQNYVLSFYAGGDGERASLQVLLNGNVIKEPFDLPSGWGEKTIMRLPPTSILQGKNVIEVHASRSDETAVSWGISEVRVIREERTVNDPRNGFRFDPDAIEEVLGNRDLSGPELARLYETLESQEGQGISPQVDREVEHLLSMVEERMVELLYKTAFDIRSRRLKDDGRAAEKLADETGKWVPPSWRRGWKIYDELYR